MKIGAFTVEQLSEGLFEFTTDGSIRKLKKVEKIDLAGKKGEFMSQYTAVAGIDPLLIRHDDQITLVDMGLGLGLDSRTRDDDTSNIVTNLSVFNIDPATINNVILSHLHYDHIGGLSFSDRDLRTTTTLSNAQYFVQQAEWDYAIEQQSNPSDLIGSGYDLDEMYRLVADGQVTFIQGAHHQLAPGIELIRTGGHTPGHQIVRISSEGEVGYFMGDLISADSLLNYSLKNVDYDPAISKQMKMEVLRKAYQEKAVLLFYHSIYNKMGRVTKDKENRQYLLERK